MTDYEQCIYFYTVFSKMYHWTVKEIDETELEILFDYLLVSQEKETKQKNVYIDEIMP